MTKKSQFKRLLSLCLVLSMVFSLLPMATFAVTAGIDYEPTVYTDFSSVLSADASFTGFVARYNKPGENGNDKGANVIRIDFGIYKIPNTETIDMSFWYDPAVLSLAKYNTDGTVAKIVPDEFDGVVDNDKIAAIVPVLLTEDVVVNGSSQKDAIINSYIFPNTPAGLTALNGKTQRAVMSQPDAARIDLGAQLQEDGTYKSDLTGAVMWTLTAKCATNFMSHNKMIADTDVLNTTSIDAPIYFSSLYFIVDDISKVNDKTFHMVSSTQSETGAAAMAADTGTHTTNMVFLGFPQAEKPVTPVDVTFNVTKTFGSSDFLTKAPTITIEPADDTVKVDGDSSLATYVGGFSATTDGKLTGKKTADGAATLIENSTLKLYPGTYNWTLTPADDEPANADGLKYITCSDTFTVTEGMAAVNLHAQLETVDPKTYVLTVTNDAGNPVKGATVTVSGTGLKGICTGGEYTAPAAKAAETVTQSAETDVNGRVAISALPNQAYEVIVSGTGYGTQKGTMRTAGDTSFTLSGNLSTNSDGSVVMSAPKTNLTLNIKEGDAAAPAGTTVTVTWAGEGTSPIGPTRVQADNGSVKLSLPDGKYTYTVSSPGKDDVKYTLEIKTTTQENGDKSVTATITPPGESSTPIVVTGSSTHGADVTIDTPVESVVGAAIEDMYYAVEGKWTDETKKDEMKVTVSVVNAPAGTVLDGTFGFQYDTNVFDAAAAVTYEPTIKVLTKSSDGWFFTNPTTGSGSNYAYHVFYWEAAKDADNKPQPIGDGSTPVLIATYTLKVKEDLAKQGADAVSALMNDKTLSCRSLEKTGLPDEYKTDNPNLDDFAREAFWAQHWQNFDDARRSSSSWQFDALGEDKALDGGFYQVHTTKQTGASVTMVPQDIRMQITFDDSNLNKAVQFNVVGISGTPIEGAAISLMKDGNPVLDKDNAPVVGTTDEFGKVTIQLPDPNETGYAFTVERKGYKDFPDTVEHPEYANGMPLSEYDLDDVIDVTLQPDNAPDVIIKPDTQVTLLGSNKFPVDGTNYAFNVEAKPGYVLTNDPPKLTDLTVEVYKNKTDANGIVSGVPDGAAVETLDASKLTWNAEKNHFEIAAMDKYNADYVVVITVNSDKVTPKTDGYKVNVKADSAGGYFNVDKKAEGSNFDKTVTDNTTKFYDIVETLDTGKTTSSTYHFYANEPDDKPNQDLKAAHGQYEGYVINQLLVNGAPVSLTEAERIHGVTQRLLGITSDQDITVTYMKAHIDGKGTDTPGDDIIMPEPAPTPIGDAIVTVVVGDYGSVTVTGVTPAQPGPSTKDYTVTAGTFEMTVTAETNVSTPDSTTENPKTANYEIDKVIVMDADGTMTTVYDAANPSAADAKWSTTDNKLTLSALPAGDHKVVMVTFKNVNGDTMQALVQTVNKAGNGNIAQSGLLVYTIGDEPVFTLTPDASWDLSELKVHEPEGADLSKKRYAVAGKDTDGNVYYTYKMDALKAGTTTLTYEFAEKTYDVRLTVHYAMMSSTINFTPVTDVSISYVRMAGGDGTAQSGTQTYNKTKTQIYQEYQLNLSAGTWTITVSKPGYLDFVITEFTINDSGTVEGDGTTNTKVNKDDSLGTSSIVFGQLEGDGEKLHMVAPVIGDADHDNVVISIGDISQVNNGLIAGAGQASKTHADIDESGTLSAGQEKLTEDMTYVVNSFGKGVTRMTYAAFVKSNTYEKNP